jgi:hypothetical protein
MSPDTTRMRWHKKVAGLAHANARAERRRGQRAAGGNEVSHEEDRRQVEDGEHVSGRRAGVEPGEKHAAEETLRQPAEGARRELRGFAREQRAGDRPVGPGNEHQAIQHGFVAHAVPQVDVPAGEERLRR